MPTFTYKARDKFSKFLSGSMTADSRQAAIKSLKDMGYVPIGVEQERENSPASIFLKFQRVSPDQLTSFTRQLYSLQKAGIPLLSSLEALSQQARSLYFHMVISRLATDIRTGLSLSQALSQFPNVFNEVYVGMVSAAESSGSLPQVLERLIDLLERDIETKQKIQAATRYPIIAFGVICLGFTILVAFVIPRFSTFYAQFGATLPLPTRILIAVHTFVVKFWFVALSIIAVAIVSFWKFLRSSLGRAWWDNLKLSIPIFGPLILMLTMSRFCRITAILLNSGVPILQVLDLVGAASGNVIVRRTINTIKESVRQGKGISEPMRISELFPPAVVQMVAVGERSGTIGELLLSVADYYDRESSYTIKNLTTYIEPLLILILGIMVLVLALGIFMPMWNLIRVFKPS